MKILIASDLHGSAYWTEKLMCVYKNGNFDSVILLGDLLYHGPRNDLPQDYNPKKVISMLSEIKDKIIAVRGNCDAEVDQMVLPFPILATYKTLIIDNKVWYLTHGHIINEDSKPKNISVFLSGHTHIPVLKETDGVLIINPGSTSIPKGGSEPGYAIYDNGTFKLEIFK